VNDSWADQSDGSYGVSWAYVQPPDFIYTLYNAGNAFFAAGNDGIDLTNVQVSDLLSISPGTTFFDHVIQFVLPHTGNWADAEPQVQGLVEGVSVTPGTAEAQ